MKTLRIVLRLILCAIAVFFSYGSTTKGNPQPAGLVVILGLLVLMFLGTYVITLESNKKKIGGNGLPGYLKFTSINLLFLGLVFGFIVFGDLLNEQVSASRSAKIVYLRDDPVHYWVLVGMDSVVSVGCIFLSALIFMKRRRRTSNSVINNDGL